MRISVNEAKKQLTDLVRRAEAGDEVILTQDGQNVVRLVPEPQRVTDDIKARRMAVLEKVYAAAKPTPGPSAARSQDFLYDDDGLPG